MPSRPAIREDVYGVVDGERDYQESLREEGRFTEVVLPLASELVLIRSYLRKAEDSYSNNPGEVPEETLHIVRKIAAMAIRALEHYGAPER